jgi:hypothetical protein
MLFGMELPFGLNLSCKYLGPLHTRAKSREHENVRAQEKVFKGRPNTPPESCSVVTDPLVSHALNQMLFQWIFIHAGPPTR